MKPETAFALENAGWPAMLLDAGSTILRASPAAIKLFGPALEGASPMLSAIWSPENGVTAEQFLARWERSPTPAMSLKFRIKGGGTATYAAALSSHTREQQRFFILQLLPEGAGSEPKFQTGVTAVGQRQKLDCALQLARTVALDFNNALTSILGHTSLLLSRAEADHPWRHSLLEVEKSAARAAEVASDLAAFSRQDREPRAPSAGNLNTLLRRSVESLQNTGAAAVTWQFDLESRLFAARFDEAKIQQAVMKVLENAIEAVPVQGRIVVQTRNVELGAPTQDHNARLAPGAYVCASITDNGAGVAPAVLPRVFQPFFTTKPAPHRGLGLAWVYGIVTNHGGAVSVSSPPGAGATVRLYLPADPQIVKDSSEASQDLTGDQTILIVDDEGLLLTTGETILSAYGYHVLTANSGPRALEILTGEQTPVDLVITDLVMPAMSGRELVERIRQVAPGMRVLRTSGYVWPSGQQEDSPYLQKPFTSQELLQQVKDALSGPQIGG